jgi:hypothetical protein
MTSSQEFSFSTDRHPSGDAQAQAALILVESLIHSLIDNGSLTTAQALEAIDSALEVKEESAADEKEPAEVLQKSLTLLQRMRTSIGSKTGASDD